MPCVDGTPDSLRRSMIIGTPVFMRRRQMTIETDVIQRQESLDVCVSGECVFEPCVCVC